jgi:hypothetical protein
MGIAREKNARAHGAVNSPSGSGRILKPERSGPGRVLYLSIGSHITAAPVAGLFFPLDHDLNLRSDSYSPWVLDRLEWAGGNLESFQKGSQAIQKMLDLEITPHGLGALTEKLGEERASRRDEDVKSFENKILEPLYREAPAVAVVMLDGGRAQVRASEAATGVHEPAWTETKVANLSTYTNINFKEDPQPEPPEKFLDTPQVIQLVKEMKGFSGAKRGEERQKAARPKTPAAPEAKKERTTPERKVRTVVATTGGCEQFGPMVAAEAMRRGFYGAGKKAALGDGSLWIWRIVELHLVGFVPILDFLHLLGHLFSAAHAAFKGEVEKAWKLYVKLLKLAWGGKIEELENELRKHALRVGKPPEKCSDDDPRKILARAIDYIDKNRNKMDYPRYRRQGLPISSAPVESLIKEMNLRVKGTEKFWIREGLEAILQVRAAHLSEDGRAEALFAKRPLGRAAGKNLFRRSKEAA